MAQNQHKWTLNPSRHVFFPHAFVDFSHLAIDTLAMSRFGLCHWLFVMGDFDQRDFGMLGVWHLWLKSFGPAEIVLS